jgi:hypothetical protein
MCRSVADRIIRNYEEFGPDYFAIAQVTGISANEYRRIGPSVRNHALLHAGEEIPIELENATRLVAAVDALRREPAVEEPAPSAGAAAEPARSFAKAERAFRNWLAELDKLRFMPLDIGERVRLQSAVGEAAGKIKVLELQVRV